MSFYKTSEDEMKRELAAALDDSTWLSQLFDEIRVEVVDLQERLSTKDGPIRSIV